MFCWYFVIFGSIFCTKGICLSYILFILLLTLEIEKIMTLFEFSILIGWFLSKSVKVSRKIGWSSIPSKSVQVLWWTLIKVFFDRLHYQSLRQKLWPSFLVQENFDSVNGTLQSVFLYVDLIQNMCIYFSKKSLAPLALYSLYSKLAESITLPIVKKNVWNNTEILYKYVKTNTHISEFTR